MANMLHIGTIARTVRGTLTATALAAALLLPAGTAFIGSARAESVIKVVVNDDAITSMDVQSRARLLQLAMHLAPGPAAKAAQDELIDERLDAAHDASKRLFFGLLTPDAVERLGPVYD